MLVVRSLNEYSVANRARQINGILLFSGDVTWAGGWGINIGVGGSAKALTANSAKTAQDITVEVDRYIVWPGQALAYKSGELEIKALRKYAEQELGARFDIRAFHDQILSQGGLPLDVLHTRIWAWVAEQKRGS